MVHTIGLEQIYSIVIHINVTTAFNVHFFTYGKLPVSGTRL